MTKRKSIKRTINKGRHLHRFENNPLEQLYAKAWEQLNTDSWDNDTTTGILDYLLAEDPNLPRREVTERDRVVAATVVQWLGSPVGISFVDSVLKKARGESEAEEE